MSMWVSEHVSEWMSWWVNELIEMLINVCTCAQKSPWACVSMCMCRCLHMSLCLSHFTERTKRPSASTSHLLTTHLHIFSDLGPYVYKPIFYQLVPDSVFVTLKVDRRTEMFEKADISYISPLYLGWNLHARDKPGTIKQN